MTIFFAILAGLAGILMLWLLLMWALTPVTITKKTSTPVRSRGKKKPVKRTETKETGSGNNTQQRKINSGRTESGKVPQGRTLTTKNKHLNKETEEPEKERPVVVIEADEENNLAVVELTSRDGKNRTRMKNYQDGKSRFRHFVEIEDTDGEPIRVNEKFRENHPYMDVSAEDVEKIRDKVFNHSSPKQQNQEKIKKFRTKKG